MARVPVLTSAPAAEPVLIGEAKKYARVQHAKDDDLLTGMIVSGRQRCEKISGRALITQTWKLTLDSFYGDRREDVLGERDGRVFFDYSLGHWVILLPRPPLQSVSSVKYVFTDGVQYTLDPSLYTVDTASQPGRIMPAFGQVWPVTRLQPNAIEISFVAGYGATGDSVPAEIKDRIKGYVAYRYERREEPDEDFLDRIFTGFWTGTM